jgi:hypothetical protein
MAKFYQPWLRDIEDKEQRLMKINLKEIYTPGENLMDKIEKQLELIKKNKLSEYHSER